MAHDRRTRSATAQGETNISRPASADATPFSPNAWRNLLATGVASAALFAYGGRPVRAQTVPPASPCNTISGTTGSIVTCSGDVSTGVLLNNGGGPYAVLNVTNLTTDIAPASGVTGIFFASTGAAELNVDAGAFAIRATDARGIFASSNSSTVTINSTADIVTTGSGAVGLQGSAQDSLLTITSSGDIATSGNNAFGIAAGTVYGDIIVNSAGDIATSGTFSAGINVGSIGQFGTTQGAITINSSGDIATTGVSAIGINASTVYGPIDITSVGDIAVSGAASVGINAQAQGEVQITSTGSIAAGPDSSVGILALSQAASALITSTGDIATAGQTGIGIYARAGQIATVYAFGNITTLGHNAPGIVARGDTGTAVYSTGDIRTFGTGAYGIIAYGPGDVVVTSTGNITTTGNTSDGISVMSTNGMAEVVNMGAISATGTGSAGIYAAGQSGTLVVNFGTVEGCPCAGVIMISTGTNQLTNYGSIIAAAGGTAIESAGADTRIDNYGIITGDVDVAFGTGTFNNHAGALFNAGTLVEAGLVTNDGTLAPGGRGAILSTSLAENLVQNAGGIFAVDVGGAAADAMIVSDTANLAGNVDVDVLSLPTLASYTILQAMGGTLIDNGLGLIASPALNAALQFNGADLDLVFAIDFSPTWGLNPNQRDIAVNLNQIFLAGGGGVTPVLLGLLNVDSLAAYKAALDQLSPELYSDAEIAALYASLGFANSLLSCKVNGAGTAAIIREGQCLWAGAAAQFLDTGTTTDQIGFSQTSALFTAGAQVALDEVWRLGFAGGYQSSTLRTATGAQSEGALAQGGVSLKYNPGPLLLAGVASGGGGRYDTKRPMAFGGFAGTAEGDQSLGIIAGSLRAAYVLGTPHVYFKPILDLGLTRLKLGGFTESGGGGAALSVAGNGQTVFSLAPTLEVGSEWWLANGTLVRPLLRAGAIWYEGADFALTAAFAGAPVGVSPFTINTDIDEMMGLVGAGVEVINGADAALRLSYEGQLGETTRIHAVGIKGSATF